MDKSKEILKYSNPSEVLRNAKGFLGDDVQLMISSQKNKKYMILNPNTQKWVHFGFFGMEDFTKHKNEDRRYKFLVRNKRFRDADTYTPGWLSYYLLW